MDPYYAIFVVGSWYTLMVIFGLCFMMKTSKNRRVSLASASIVNLMVGLKVFETQFMKLVGIVHRRQSRNMVIVMDSASCLSILLSKALITS
jgi:hypothetical protein